MFEPADRLKPVDLAGVAVVAALLRAWHLVAIAPDPLASAVVGDSAVYVERAHALLAGTVRAEHAFTPPLYPVFLAAVFAVAGEALGLVKAIQAAIGVGASVAVAAATGRLLGRRAGLVAGLFLAASPVAIFFDGEILATSLTLGLVAVSVFAAARVLTGGAGFRRTMLDLGICGASLATAALGQPQAAALLAGAVPVALAGDARQKRQRLLALLGSASLIFLLGAIVQARASGHWVWISAGGGVNLAIGNHPGAEGGFDLPREWGLADTRQGLFATATRIAARELSEPLPSPSAVSRYWTSRTLDWMSRDPSAFLMLLGKKLLLALNHYEIPNHYSLEYFAPRSPVIAWSPARFALLLPLAAIGLVALGRAGKGEGRNRRASPRSPLRTWLYLSLGALWLALALFFITDRYRLLAWPHLTLAGGLGAVTLADAVRSRSLRRIAAPAGVAAAAALVCLVPSPPRFSPGHMQLLLSEVLAERGDAAGARQALIAAAESGEIIEAVHNLGNALYRERRYAEAAHEFRRALAIAPEAPETWYALALAEIERGDPPAASAALARALALAPDDERLPALDRRLRAAASLLAGALGTPPPPWPAGADSAIARRDAVRALSALALADAQGGRPDVARDRFRHVLRLEPDDKSAHLNLALLAEQTGDYRGAAKELAAAAALGAGDHIEWLLCAARVALALGERKQARAWFVRASEVAPDDPRGPAALRALDAPGDQTKAPAR